MPPEASTSGSAATAVSATSTALTSLASNSRRQTFRLLPTSIIKAPSPPAPPAQYLLPLCSATLDGKILDGRRLRMRFGASEAQLGLVDADDAEVGKEMQEESLLVFGCSSVKGLKVVVNRWLEKEGSDVTVTVFLPPSLDHPGDAPGPLRTLELVVDTQHASGFSPSRFERLKARLRLWGAKAPYGMDISNVQALRIPPPDVSLASFGPLPPQYDPLVPSTWVPTFSAPPSKSTAYTLRKGPKGKKAVGGESRQKSRRVSGAAVAPVRAPSQRKSVGPSGSTLVGRREVVAPALVHSWTAPARAPSVGPSEPASVGGGEVVETDSAHGWSAPARAPSQRKSVGPSESTPAAVDEVMEVDPAHSWTAPARAPSQRRSIGSAEVVEPVADDESDSDAPLAKKARITTPVPSTSTSSSKPRKVPLSENAQLRFELKTLREQHHKLKQRHESESSRRKKAEKDLAAAAVAGADTLRAEMVELERRFEAKRVADLAKFAEQVRAAKAAGVGE